MGEPWTEQEDKAVLAAAFNATPWKRTANKLGRSLNAVTARVRKLRRAGFDVPRRARKPKDRRTWTDAEIAKLKADVQANRLFSDIAKDMGRTVSAVKSKAWVLMGRRGPTRRNRRQQHGPAARVIELSKRGVPREDIAEEFGVTVSTITRWAKEHGHNPSGWTRREYTLADDDRIRSGYAKRESPKLIAADLERTPASIRMRALKLGVTPIRRMRKTWTTAELKRAFELYESGNNYAEVAKLLGRSRASVKSAMDNHRRRQ